jgi:hypothetical protein
MKIGQLIRDLKFNTNAPSYFEKGYDDVNLVPKDKLRCSIAKPVSKCTCLSACSLIYLAGFRRNGNYIGIHRTYINHDYLKDLSLSKAKKYSSNISRLLKEYLTQMEAPDSLLEKMEAISSSNIELLDKHYINKYLRGYSKGTEEWLIAKCGDEKHIDNKIFLKLSEKKKTELIDESVKSFLCKSKLIDEQRNLSYYDAISKAFEAVDKDLIPRHSLLEYLIDKTPFDLTGLIGKSNFEAMDLLSLVGIPNKGSLKKTKGLINATYRINKKISIGFDTDGKVYSLSFNFYESTIPDNEIYDNHFISNMNKKSSPTDFINLFGEPSYQSCSSSGVCSFIFSRDKADLEIMFNKDKNTLRHIRIKKLGYWKSIMDRRSKKNDKS